MRVVSVELDRLNQAHHRRRPFTSTQRARKQPVVPSYRNRPDLVFDPIVFHWQLPILQESRQRFPTPQAVIDRFGRGRAFGHLLPIEHQPLVQGLHQRLTLFLAHGQITPLDINVNAVGGDSGCGSRLSDGQLNEGGHHLVGRLRQEVSSGIGQFTQPAVQDVVIDAMVSGHRGDRHAGNATRGDQLGFELGAVGAAATAGLGGVVVGVHVSTICCVDTMLLDLGCLCQMGWPDAYDTAHTLGESGLPILNGALAWFECHNRSRHEEGDHVIFVGEVDRCGFSDETAPLIYQGGQFSSTAPLNKPLP
jgi:hypothetical protein